MIIENKISLNGLIAWVAVQKGVRPTIAVTCAKSENAYCKKDTIPVATVARCKHAAPWANWRRMPPRFMRI